MTWGGLVWLEIHDPEEGMTGDPGSIFDRRASSYQSDAERWPWRVVRRRESDCVLRMIGDVTNSNVLELGSGSGFYSRLLLTRGSSHVWAVDTSSAMLMHLPGKGVTAIEADAAVFRIDRSFDVILSAGLLEFVPDPLAVLRNAAAHASPKTVMVLLIPRFSILGLAYRQYHCAHRTLVKLFRQKEIIAMARAAEWKVERMTNCWPFSIVVRLTRF